MPAFPSLPRTRNNVYATPLDTAAIQGHGDIVNLILETDPSLTRISRINGKTALHSAIRMGHVDVVNSLLNKDPKMCYRMDKKGQTALHKASKRKNAEILLELLKHGVSYINEPDNMGNTPLHIATRKANTDVGDCILGNLLCSASRPLFRIYIVNIVFFCLMLFMESTEVKFDHQIYLCNFIICLYGHR